MRWLLVILTVIIGLLVGSNYFHALGNRAVPYETGTVTRGDIVESVAVTGYAEPVDVQVVQSEVMGIVEAVRVDFNAPVKKGDELAVLSSEFQRVKVQQAKAVLEAAKVDVATSEELIKAAKAGVEAAKAALTAQQSQFQKLQNLGDNIPEQDLEGQRSKVQIAQAAVIEADSRVAQALSKKSQAENQLHIAGIALNLAELELEKAILRSPRDGFVLTKDIRLGDVVGRPKFSLSDVPPALFEISAPLDKMRAIVKVSEADYGRIKVGQTATFSVDAFPEETFTATVTQIRSTPSAERTAVTYGTVLEFENRQHAETRDWMVKPRFTVSADVKIREAKNVLCVSNDALLFTPSDFSQEIPVVGQGESLIWTLGLDGAPVPRKIQKGITDGMRTEIVGGDLKEGDVVIVSQPVVEKTPFQLPIGN